MTDVAPTPAAEAVTIPEHLGAAPAAPAITGNAPSGAPLEATVTELLDVLHLERTASQVDSVWSWLVHHYGVVRPVVALVTEAAGVAAEAAGVPASDVSAVESRVTKIEEGLAAILKHLGVG